MQNINLHGKKIDCQNIKQIEYSPLSFVLTGEGTRAIKEDIKRLGGKPNWNLKDIGFGWIFSNKRKDDVIQYLTTLKG